MIQHACFSSLSLLFTQDLTHRFTEGLCILLEGRVQTRLTHFPQCLQTDLSGEPWTAAWLGLLVGISVLIPESSPSKNPCLWEGLMTSRAVPAVLDKRYTSNPD